MEIEVLIVNKVSEATFPTKNGGEFRRATYLANIAGGHGVQQGSIVFDVLGNNIDKLSLQVGCRYKVQLNVEAQCWNGRWFNRISAWKAEEMNVKPTEVMPEENEGDDNNNAPVPSEGDVNVPF